VKGVNRAEEGQSNVQRTAGSKEKGGCGKTISEKKPDTKKKGNFSEIQKKRTVQLSKKQFPQQNTTQIRGRINTSLFRGWEEP